MTDAGLESRGVSPRFARSTTEDLIPVVERARNERDETPPAAGKVWLVGAGPGDAGLLTVKGLRALEAADVIVADRLGARAVLDGLAADGVHLRAEVVDVGKRPGHHAVPQDAINALLVQLAQDGKAVVRLKGGDPYVFGRGGEELAACQDAGISVEVVPGITSAISVPAIAGIPLTHRGVATAFTVATGHDQIRDLGGGRDHTVVLLMGVGTLAHSAIILARGERGADCPVAVVEDGYGARQRVTVGTLATIAHQAAERGIRSPAVVVVGDVVRLSPYAPAALQYAPSSLLDDQDAWHPSLYDPLAPERTRKAPAQ
ncbi:uroporphyrinogen-III C-methyltransferase [Microbacterium cremeum]|uniref:uroporphyrinogen-III C-methyltransferase n=1 Tax=Microbacterium cremeum TaxID=2782169 RepID=UPI001E654B16|nr:uroporphyrinogen-III C-methyltransferase [Microbacterium cremeum]